MATAATHPFTGRRRGADRARRRRRRACSRRSRRPVRLAQRTWVPAMVPWRATEDGFVTDDVLDWYGRFAAASRA